MYCLIPYYFNCVNCFPNIWEFFSFLYFIDLDFYFPLVGEHAMYDPNPFKCIETCHYSPEYNLSW